MAAVTATGRWYDLAKRIGVMHTLWQKALADLTVEQVNHRERPGVLPIAFSLFHYVHGEDRHVAERLLGKPPIWDAGWAARTGIDSDPVPRGTPIDIAEQVRVRDLDAWRGYQTEVFERTEATLGSLPEGRWDEVLYERVPQNLKGGFIGMLAGEGPVKLGDLMDSFLFQHGMRHLGEIEHARSLVGLQGVS